MLQPLAPIKRIYLDTNVLIALVESAHCNPEILDSLNAIPGKLVLSSIARYECLVRPISRDDENLCMAYQQLFSHPGWHIPQISEGTLQLAMELGAPLNFRLADALHLALAYQSNCDEVISNDMIWSRQNLFRHSKF